MIASWNDKRTVLPSTSSPECLLQGRGISSGVRPQCNVFRGKLLYYACMTPLVVPMVANAGGTAGNIEWLGPVQEDMYSYVTYADDQMTKGKGTSIVES